MFGIYADDDGFVGSPKTIMRQCGIKNTAFEELIKNNYIIPFKSGVIVITHWKVNNYLRIDRYKKTIHTKELSTLQLDENSAYYLNENSKGIPLVYQMDTQDSIGKDSIGKNSILPVSSEPKTEKETKHRYGTYKNVLLSDKDIENLKVKFPKDYLERIENMSAAIEMKGYKYKNHYLALLKWANNEKPKSNRPDLKDPNRYKGDISL